MKHPSLECQKKQEEFLSNCSEDEREFHEKLFRIGNATYIYHNLASNTPDKILEKYFMEWLGGLPENIRRDMEKNGFEKCKTNFPFTRYVNERNDIGLDEWLKNNLSKDDYNFWIGLGKQTEQ